MIPDHDIKTKTHDALARTIPNSVECGEESQMRPWLPDDGPFSTSLLST